ncbi:type II toxin-antitoxin system HicB family antitoxin [Cellulomonas hominis]
MTYTVRVTREGASWLGDVPGLPGGHSYAHSLRALDERMREVIALVEDLPEGAEPGLDLAWDYSAVAPEAVAVAHLAQERAEAERARERIASDTRRLVTELIDKGWTSRDVAAVLGLSPGRVSQLASGPRTHAA